MPSGYYSKLPTVLGWVWTDDPVEQQTLFIQCLRSPRRRRNKSGFENSKTT